MSANYWLITGIGCTLAAITVCIFCSFVLFDRILRIQHARYHDRWVADGKAIGFFWIPSGGDIHAGGMARSVVCFGWLFQTPAWLGGEPDGLASLRRMRILVFATWIAIGMIEPLLIGGLFLLSA